jgi:hypothetical protein
MNSSDFQATMHEPSAKQYNVKENMFIGKLIIKLYKILSASTFSFSFYSQNQLRGE